MGKKAQASMEYLMTYGLMLAVVAITLGVIVFMGSAPAAETKFQSSNPEMVLVQGGKFSEGTVELKLLSFAGDEMEITSFAGGFGGECSLNGEEPTSAVIGQGGQLSIVCTEVDASGLSEYPIIIGYNDYSNLPRQVMITAGNAPA
jgi:hypothetical protein